MAVPGSMKHEMCISERIEKKQYYNMTMTTDRLAEQRKLSASCIAKGPAECCEPLGKGAG